MDGKTRDSSEGASQALLSRWNAGDPYAAREIHDRYARRLMALVRAQMGSQFQPRLDAEDVAQSAFRSFFAHDRQDAYVWRRSGDLWRLLAGITLHKLQHQIERHSAGKRNVASEVRPDERQATSAARSATPDPAESVAAMEEFEAALRRLTADEREVVSARMSGHTIEEIAGALRRSQRTVRRWLQSAESKLEALLSDR